MFKIVDIFHVFYYFTSRGENDTKLDGVFINISSADIYGSVVAVRQPAD